MYVSIMTLLVSYSYVVLPFYVFHPSMEKSTAKASKLSSSASLSSDRGKFKSYSDLSRCDSFSSCSNDSSVYSCNNLVQTRFRNAKRTVSHSTGLCKRSRNSSGSSVSSNVSCISDKDLKSTGIISQRLLKTEVKNCINNETKASQMNYSKINTSNIELKEESIVNKELNCSENSLVILPNRHNLRGKITKKGCACCPSTCATVVLRHYKKYIKTEEKMVISSTKVKTYVQKNSSENKSQINEGSNISSNKSKTRKRRSEIEKLYESLHEIEWAKNFSPDNILRQINVRQAASCSIFGRSQINTDHLSEKISKNQKEQDNFEEVNSSLVKSPKSVKSKISSKHAESNNCEVIPNMSKEICLMANCDNKQNITDLQTTKITASNIYQCKQNRNSHSSVNITSCSASHINVKEMNVKNSRESLHTESVVTENGTDFSDDAQLSYTSDESSSAVSSSIVNLQSKHILDFNYKSKSSTNLSDAEVSEYPTTPTFLDIAEEGIRTIDACFREVGAEVVVSTCYDEESSLPLLTSVRENKISSIGGSDDGPPILEPCIDLEFNHNVKNVFMEKFENQVDIKREDNFKLPMSYPCKLKTYKTRCLNSVCCDCQNCVALLSSKKCHYIMARKILKKYLKQSWTKAQLNYLSKNRSEAFTRNKNTELPKRSDGHFCSVNACSEEKENKSSTNIQNSVLLPLASKSCEIPSKTSAEKTNKIIFPQITDKYSTNKAKDGMLASTKNGSCLYETGKALKYQGEVKKASIMSQSSFSQSKSVISSFVSTKAENDCKGHKEHVSRPPSSFGFSTYYKSIRVNRSYNYTHIILLVTRGKSIFLTLEALRELRDALNRTNNDNSCQVLIINGVGDSFCLGLDLKQLVGPRKKINCTEMAVAVKELIEALSDFKKPLAAVVNGPALGLGMTLLNHADLTIASDKATFCMPYSYLGYMPEGGATLTLPQIVGSTVAMDLLLRGKTLTAREACNVGLISEVVEAKRLPHELVSRIRVLAENSLSALETTKALLKLQLHVNLRLVLENEVKLLPRMWLTRTCQDALRRALESGILSE